MFEGGENKERPNLPPKEDDVERSRSGYSNKDFGIDNKEDEIRFRELYGKRQGGKRIKNMSNPEKEQAFTEKGEQKGRPFEEKIKDFVSPKEGKPLLTKKSPFFNIAYLASLPRNQNLEELQKLLREGDRFYIQKAEDEWLLLSGVIEEEISKLAKVRKEAEPEIERLERPKTSEEAVGTFLDEIFNLHERGLREGKSWEKTGELFSEYTTIQRWVKDLPKEIKGERHENLSKAFEREYPEGVFLKEKLELFLEAMKRLHNREIEVKRAEGGLEDLGVGKTGESAAPILKVPLTNIRPVDWYILTHVDELFPESNKLENKIKLEVAWDKWQEIGKKPYDENGNLRKIKIANWVSPYTLKDLYQSDRVMAIMRSKIAEMAGNQIGNTTAGIRAESLAHSILTIALTFDMWDRERWKQKGKQNARDLIWFDWKRIKRFLELRPCGPWDTVGCYFADEKLMNRGFKEKDVLGQITRRELKMRKGYLMRNKQWALFGITPLTPSRGTIVGDFFNSTTYEETKNDYKRLADVSLKKIPWLNPQKFEEETYEGYFTYSLMFAASMEGYIKKLDWKPDDLKNKDFWVGLTDLTLRLGHFSPLLVTRERDEQNKHIFKFRRILARGILWTGSYLAQPEPGRVFTSGTLSREDVYGERLFGVIKSKPGILETITSTGYLDRKNMDILKRQIRHFNFFLKGSTSFSR